MKHKDSRRATHLHPHRHMGEACNAQTGNWRLRGELWTRRRDGVKWGGEHFWRESMKRESASCQRWMCLEFPGVELSLLSDSPPTASSSPPTAAPRTPLAPQIKRRPALFGCTALASRLHLHRDGACLLSCGGMMPGVTPSVSLVFQFAELFLVGY